MMMFVNDTDEHTQMACDIMNMMEETMPMKLALLEELQKGRGVFILVISEMWKN